MVMHVFKVSSGRRVLSSSEWSDSKCCVVMRLPLSLSHTPVLHVPAAGVHAALHIPETLVYADAACARDWCIRDAACNLSTSTCGRKGGWCRRGRGWGFRHGVEGSQLTQAGESSPDAAVCRRGSVAPSTPALKQSPGRVRRGTSTRSGSHGELIPWGSSRGRTFAPPPLRPHVLLRGTMCSAD